MKKKKILIIDDEIDLLEIIYARLTSTGFEAFTASNGKEGIEKALEIKPDLILLDIMMPEMDGFQVCQALRESPQTNSIPIVVLTALTEKENISKIMSLGASGYIIKPFDSSELLDFIGEFLKEKRP